MGTLPWNRPGPEPRTSSLPSAPGRFRGLVLSDDPARFEAPRPVALPNREAGRTHAGPQGPLRGDSEQLCVANRVVVSDRRPLWSPCTQFDHPRALAIPNRTQLACEQGSKPNVVR